MWLNVGDNVVVQGDISSVTHLSLCNFEIAVDGTMGRCPRLEQLVLTHAKLESLAIPAGVKALVSQRLLV